MLIDDFFSFLVFVQQTSVNKAINAQEVPVKEKHVRSILYNLNTDIAVIQCVCLSTFITYKIIHCLHDCSTTSVRAFMVGLGRVQGTLYILQKFFGGLTVQVHVLVAFV